MRISEHEHRIIKETISDFDPEARIYLFGSRTDNTQKGGDIDILIESSKLNFAERIVLKTRLLGLLGEQKIDLLSRSEIDDEFYNLIKENMIPL